MQTLILSAATPITSAYVFVTGKAHALSIIDFQQSDNLFSPAVGNRDPDDLRQNSSASFPPEFYVSFLQSKSIMTKIGAGTKYQECPDAPFELFSKTGDVIVRLPSTRDLEVLSIRIGCKNVASAIRSPSQFWSQGTHLGT